jgi:hypothetical protein
MKTGDMTKDEMENESATLEKLLDDESGDESGDGSGDGSGDDEECCEGSKEMLGSQTVVNGSDSDDKHMEDSEEDENDPVEDVVVVKVVKKGPKKSVSAKTDGVAKAKKPKVVRTKSEKDVAKVKKIPVVKVKKPRTVRRPYKLLSQDKLDAKQAVTHGRFEVISKRMTSTQKLLERLDFEVAFRKDTV